MKKIMVFMLLASCINSYAQDTDEKKDEKRDEKKGFKKEKLFTGGSVSAGFSNYATVLGITPQFGYSLTNWADAGITLNLNYTSQRDYQIPGDKLRQTVYGPGAFVRLFPVKFLFASAQYEYNLIHLKYIPANNSGYTPDKNNLNASSLLVGGGYAGGRERGNNTYYYISVSWDILGDKNSPYIDGFGRSNPIIRAGYNIGLFQGRKRDY
ncbi:MAG TPA: hypothetical protein VGP55_15705 [Chitinophagaceae bacterium]|nr:hypothetical protein [Chitinophagaceae bacterium]